MRPKVNFEPEAWVPLASLKPHPKNPRVDLSLDKDRFESLKNSIQEGVFEPVKISKKTGFCLAGNQRLKAFAELGYEEIPVMYNDCPTEKDEIIVMIKDNNEWGMYKFDELVELVDEFELPEDELGFTEAETKELEAMRLNPDELGEEFELEDGEKAPFTQMTITLAEAQAELVEEAFKKAKASKDFEKMENYGNLNENGNALFYIVSKWLQ